MSIDSLEKATIRDLPEFWESQADEFDRMADRESDKYSRGIANGYLDCARDLRELLSKIKNPHD